MSKQLSLSATFSVLATAAFALSLAVQSVLDSDSERMQRIAFAEAPALGTSHN